MIGKGVQGRRESGLSGSCTVKSSPSSLTPSGHAHNLSHPRRTVSKSYPDSLTIYPPLIETAPRVPEPYALNIFYYAQYDAIPRLSRKIPGRSVC